MVIACHTENYFKSYICYAIKLKETTRKKLYTTRPLPKNINFCTTVITQILPIYHLLVWWSVLQLPWKRTKNHTDSEFFHLRLQRVNSRWGDLSVTTETQLKTDMLKLCT